MAFLVACGDDTTPADEDSLSPDTACEWFCQAAAETPGCEEPEPRCQERCDALEAERDPECSDPSDALLECLAEGAFACIDGLPVPVVDQCLEPTEALAGCLALDPCRRVCAKAEAAGCSANCLERCAFQTTFEIECREIDERLAVCREASGECREGAFRPGAACKAVAYELAACELDGPNTDEGACRAYCRIVEVEGCSETFEACQESCAALLLGECDADHRGAFDCRMEFGFTCEAGAPSPSTAPECEFDERHLRECLER